MARKFGRTHPFDPPAIPPHGAVQVGVWKDGIPIYRAKLPNPSPRKIPVLDRDGNPVHRDLGNGMKGKPLMRIDPEDAFVETEFILEKRRRTGRVVINPHFREDPETVRRQQLKERAEQITKELAMKLAEKGLSVDDLIAKIGTPAAPPAAAGTTKQAAQPELPDEHPHLEIRKRTGAGSWYDVFLDGVRLNDKAVRESEARAIYEAARREMEGAAV